MALSTKQRAFVEHYLTLWNGYKAAKAAGYSETSARHQASRMLSNDNIRAAIQERLAELKMGADEVLTRLTEHARSSPAPFLDITPEGELRGFDLSEDKPLHLLRKVSMTRRKTRDDATDETVTIENVTIELHDAQAALTLLGKHHRLFVDRTEHTGADGGPIEVTDARTILADKLARRAGAADTEPGASGDGGADSGRS